MHQSVVVSLHSCTSGLQRNAAVRATATVQRCPAIRSDARRQSQAGRRSTQRVLMWSGVVPRVWPAPRYAAGCKTAQGDLAADPSPCLSRYQRAGHPGNGSSLVAVVRRTSIGAVLRRLGGLTRSVNQDVSQKAACWRAQRTFGPHVVDTLGGRRHLRRAPGAVASPHGQPVHFAAFMTATGVFERWRAACPLGMAKMVSEDALRRALERLEGRPARPGGARR